MALQTIQISAELRPELCRYQVYEPEPVKPVAPDGPPDAEPEETPQEEPEEEDPGQIEEEEEDGSTGDDTRDPYDPEVDNPDYGIGHDPETEKPITTTPDTSKPQPPVPDDPVKPDPGIETDPPFDIVDQVEIGVTPDGFPFVNYTTQPQNNKDPAENKRRKDRKEGKGRLAYRMALRFVTKTFGTATELADFYEILMNNLYFDGVSLGDMSLQEQANIFEWYLDNPQLFDARMYMDFDQFVVDFAVNQAMDAVIGKVSQKATGARIEMGTVAGIYTSGL